MTRWLRILIALAVPAGEREWVLGDVEEEYDAIRRARGSASARRWLAAETLRILASGWRFRRNVPVRSNPQPGGSVMRSLARDLSFAARSVRRSPGFALTAVLTIALGAGANGAVSAVAYGILFKPLPYAAPERLVAVWPNRFQSQVDLRYIRGHSTTLAAVSAVAPGWTFSLTGAGDPLKITVDRVSANLFETLGARPMLGRTLQPGEDAPGSPGRILLSHRFWQEHFGGDRSVVGRVVKVDDTPHEVVGVMPRGFEVFRPDVDAWVPLPADPSAWYDTLNFSMLVGRLAPGVSLQAADSAFRAMIPAMRNDLHYPDDYGRTARVEDLREATTGPMRTSLLLLVAAVAFVLLIAGANLGTLSVARASARARALAVHAAIGASRGALTRLMLFEVLLLAAVGGAIGIALAAAIVPLLGALLPVTTPRALDLQVDVSVAAAVLGASLVVALVFGLAPAIAASRTAGGLVLREGAATGSRGARRTRGLMVAVQIALALVLAIGAGLMLQSLWRLHRVDAGIDIDRVLTLRLQPTSTRYKQADAARIYYRQVLERLAAIPGVTAAGAIQHLPFSGINWVDGYEAEGRPTPAGSARPTAGLKMILGNYLAAVGQPLVAGRAFDGSDEAAPDATLILNRTLAVRLFGTPEAAIGHRIRTGRAAGPWRTVVGVVGDVRSTALNQPPDPELYQPVTARGIPALMIAVRTDGDPAAIAPAVREAVWAVDRDVPIGDLQPMRALVGRTLAEPRLLLTLLAGFAVVGLALAAVGVYGVVAFAVARRRREVGLRIALGAARTSVVRLMLRESAAYAAAGVICGVGVSLASARVMQKVLFSVAATNPATYVLLVALVALLVFVASYIPARRAASMNPTDALRNVN
ncbi:MAG TPA: ABC transporter permease [Vicinamibacterales bacterium]